jgi:hypothetical protein
MDTRAEEEPDFVRLIEQSRTRSNRLFFALVVVSILFFFLYGPTVVDRFRGYTKGVKSAALAEQQFALWRKNATCVNQPGTAVPTRGNVMVNATVCESGDILVQVRTADNREVYKWVPLNDVVGPLRPQE